MSTTEIAVLLNRTIDVMNRLGFPKDDKLEQIDSFLSGPVVLAIAGERALGRGELAEGLRKALPSVSVRLDLSDADIEHALVDAIIITTPCDAALSSKELETIRAARRLKRPLLVVITDAEKLGQNRAIDQKEIEDLRLRPLLESEQIEWCFRAKGEVVNSEVALVRAIITSEPRRLHGKPSADLLARILGSAETEFLERCRIRDSEFDLLRQTEAQGALDLAQLAEWEKVERLRVGDRIRLAFEKVLAGAEGTGDALSAWMRSGAQGDGRDATSTIEEAWMYFLKELDVVPREALSRLHEESQRLAIRARDVASALNVEISPEVFPTKYSTLPVDLVDAAKRIAGTSIQDLIDAAIQIARSDAEKIADTDKRKKGLQTVPKRLQSAIPQALTPAELIRGHLVQGIRSRVDIRLKTFVEGLEKSLTDQATARLQGFEIARNKVIEQIRTTLAERHAWSTILGELQVLRQDIEDFRRTLS